mgnify:FL=1|jgi:hypothetical protein
MIKYLQLPFLFDIPAMQNDLASLESQSWKLHYNSQHFDGVWSALPLRSVNGSLHNIIAHDAATAVFADTELMKNCPALQAIINEIKCEKLGIRLLKLEAGAVIHAHRDMDLYFEEGEIRLHIPIKTNELVEFFLEEEQIKMQEGECWYMNLALLHNINNKSQFDRVHLVIDCVVNDWIKSIFQSPSISVKKEVAAIVKKGQDIESKRMVVASLRLLNTPVANELADNLQAEINAM